MSLKMKLKMNLIRPESFTPIPYILMGMVLSFSAWGKTFTYEKSGKGRIPIAELRERILDYESMCSDGCSHYLSSVKKAYVFPQENPDEFAVWIKSSSSSHSHFLFVKVAESHSPHKMRITSEIPEAAVVRDWERRYQLPHDSFFSHSASEWNLEEVMDAKGNFEYTQVQYNIKAQVGGLIANIMSSRIKRALKESTDKKFELIVKE